MADTRKAWVISALSTNEGFGIGMRRVESLKTARWRVYGAYKWGCLCSALLAPVVVCAFVAYLMWAPTTRRKAVSLLEQSGAQVTLEWAPSTQYPLRLRETGRVLAVELRGKGSIVDVWTHGERMVGGGDDSLLAVLPAFPELQRLVASHADVSNQGLNVLQSSTQLEEIDVSVTPIGDAGVPVFLRLPQLHALDVSFTFLTDEGLATISNMATLRRLSVGGCRISDDGLRWLRRLDRLESLGLSLTEVTDVGLVHLTALVELNELYLDGTRIRGEGLTHFREMPLRVLDVASVKFSVNGFEAMCELRGLEQLNLSLAEVPEAAAGRIADLGSLRRLTLSGVDSTSALVRALAHDAPLEYLQVGGGFTDREMNCLRSFTGLQELHLGGTAITDDSLEILLELPNLEILVLSDTAITDEGARILAQMPNLRKLALDYTKITDEGLVHLKTLPGPIGFKLSGNAISEDALAEFFTECSDRIW